MLTRLCGEGRLAGGVWVVGAHAGGVLVVRDVRSLRALYGMRIVADEECVDWSDGE